MKLNKLHTGCPTKTTPFRLSPVSGQQHPAPLPSPGMGQGPPMGTLWCLLCACGSRSQFRPRQQNVSRDGRGAASARGSGPGSGRRASGGQPQALSLHSPALLQLLCVMGEAVGRTQEAQAAACDATTPQSFLRRLYISRLLLSPAQVRLLVRNFLRSSLKSSWYMGR